MRIELKEGGLRLRTPCQSHHSVLVKTAELVGILLCGEITVALSSKEFR